MVSSHRDKHWGSLEIAVLKGWLVHMGKPTDTPKLPSLHRSEPEFVLKAAFCIIYAAFRCATTTLQETFTNEEPSLLSRSTKVFERSAVGPMLKMVPSWQLCAKGGGRKPTFLLSKTHCQSCVLSQLCALWMLQLAFFLGAKGTCLLTWHEAQTHWERTHVVKVVENEQTCSKLCIPCLIISWCSALPIHLNCQTWPEPSCMPLEFFCVLSLSKEST